MILERERGEEGRKGGREERERERERDRETVDCSCYQVVGAGLYRTCRISGSFHSSKACYSHTVCLQPTCHTEHHSKAEQQLSSQLYAMYRVSR